MQKIYNPELYGMYMLWKKELESGNSFNSTNVRKETILYHATSLENAKKIALYNIDWRRTRRTRYGIGSYFSPSPKYANTYSSERGGERSYKSKIIELFKIGKFG